MLPPNKYLLSFNRTAHPLWETLSIGNVPKDSLEICILSITASTLRQYNIGLRLWWEFCLKKNNVDPFHITVPDVLTFLTCHFKKGASYWTLNSYRSAIAQIAGPEMGQDYRLKRFFKGVFSLRQPLPRYEIMWDPGLVVNYLRSLDSDLVISSYFFFICY